MCTLETSRLFAGLSPAEVQSLRAVTREMRFAPGQQIFQEGDPGDGLYLVKTGRVQIAGRISTGETRVFAYAQPGDVFGDLAVLDGQPRSACAAAEVETEVYFIPREPMLRQIEQSPRLATVLMRELSARMRDFNRQYLREVLQAERMALVGRFAGSIVHDLKNPLAIIRMAADMLAMESASLESRGMAHQRISRQIDRIRWLVNDILDYTRGTPVSEALPGVDYGEFVQGVMAELEPEFSSAGVVLRLVNAPPAVKVALHPQRLSRVFYNLILNAKEAMPGGGEVKLSFSANSREVTTEIRDTGPGLAPEIENHLFEPFTTHGKANGTGLGLSIAQRIIGEHGGTIHARNLPEGGAAFTFTLPPLPASAA